MKKYLFAFGIASLLCIGTPIQASAEEISEPITQIEEQENVVPYLSGIITNHALSCSSSTKAVKITAKTSASESMAKIGFVDIVVQRSSDQEKWTDEVDVGEMLKSSAISYSIENHSVSVKGGYYYRVKLNHYAKGNSLFGIGGSSQSVENTSNIVWVS